MPASAIVDSANCAGCEHDVRTLGLLVSGTFHTRIITYKSDHHACIVWRNVVSTRSSDLNARWVINTISKSLHNEDPHIDTQNGGDKRQ